MRILLISDIHSNWPALAAVQEPYDVCLCVGDLVEYGPQPVEVIQWVRERAVHCVRGNHDHGTAQNIDVFGVGGFRYLTMATRTPTIELLNAEDRRYLADLPTVKLFTLAGKRFLMVHASPRDPLDEYVPADPAQWATRIAGYSVDYVLVGHTHQQFSMDVGKAKVINPGSLGLQRDGNPMARYAIIENGQIELKQIEYDYEATVAALGNTSIDLKAKQMLADVYRTGRYVHPTSGVNGVAELNGSYAKVKAIA